MVELALLRHGPTDWNAQHRFQGAVDRPLSRIGREAVRHYMIPPPVRRYRRVCSPLLRARQTAALLFGPGTPTDERLQEISFGAWEGYTVQDLEDRWPGLFHGAEALGLDFQPPGGESPRMVQDRVKPLLVELAHQGEATLAICHRKVIQSIYALADGWDMTGEPPVKVKFPRLHRFTLAEDGTPTIKSLNERIDP